MNRLRLGAWALALAVAVAGVGVVPTAGAGATVAAPPLHQLVVTGAGVATYPAFDPAVARYAARTTSQTGGTLVVTASTSDPAGVVRVDGRPVPSGTAYPVTGLAAGDEVSVLITDSAGTAAHSVIYLPADFPAVDVLVDGPGRAPGQVFLTLSSILSTTRFEAVVDRHGVPSHVASALNPMDLKKQPNGHYSVARGDTDQLDSAFEVVELDAKFRRVGGYRTLGLANTDFHDSILLPNGHRILMAYEPADGGARVDSIAQEVDAAGTVVFAWNSFSHIDRATESLLPAADYAHLNSLDVMQDGDWLLSFRNTSSVLKVARTAHDGFAAGDVAWRLGGTRSDFDFVDDPLHGPCAQHTARELPNGHIVLFDNGSRDDDGSGDADKPMCASSSTDSTAPRVNRPQSRMVEYALDEDAMTATPVWTWQRTGDFGKFAGSAQRLPNGNTMAGYFDLADNLSDAVEVSASGEVVWELDADGYSSYRAQKFDAPDAIPPAIAVSGLQDGATFPVGAQVAVDYRCTDRGGSTLQACDAAIAPGGRLDTSTPGTRTFVVTAVDGAGLRTTVSRTYTVGAPPVAPAAARHQPDVDVRGRSGTVRLPDRGDRVRVRLRVQNDGNVADRFVLDGNRLPPGLALRWFASGDDVTRAVRRGRFRTPLLAPGARFRLVARIEHRGVRPGERGRLRLSATSLADPDRADAVAVRVRAD